MEEKYFDFFYMIRDYKSCIVIFVIISFLCIQVSINVD